MHGQDTCAGFPCHPCHQCMPMQCRAMPCMPMQCYACPCNAMQCYAMLCNKNDAAALGKHCHKVFQALDYCQMGALLHGYKPNTVVHTNRCGNESSVQCAGAAYNGFKPSMHLVQHGLLGNCQAIPDEVGKLDECGVIPGRWSLPRPAQPGLRGVAARVLTPARSRLVHLRKGVYFDLVLTFLA